MTQTSPTVVFFGTFDEGAHPRVQVLREGLIADGLRVIEVRHPLELPTHERVAMLRHPGRALLQFVRLLLAWAHLVAGRLLVGRADIVVVGYLGHFDVLLARVLFPFTPIALDYLVSLADTADDRGLGSPFVHRVLKALDTMAATAATMVIVDTRENIETVPARCRSKTVVVEVGAPWAWFREPSNAADGVVFYGLYTPLQGTVAMAQALQEVVARRPGTRVTMIGDGQERRAAMAVLRDDSVTWLPWVDAVDLPALVAQHAICLGIAGVTSKAQRVVPNKCFQGAAAGALVVTSDTPPQRRTLPPETILVPPGDVETLASAIIDALADGSGLLAKRQRSQAFAQRHFSPTAVVDPIANLMREKTS